MPEIHVYVNRPPENEDQDLDGLEDVLKQLDHVSEARVDSVSNVVAVTFEGGRTEQQEIEHVIEEAGYEVSRLSVRTDYPRE